jgi:hypothetical protein
MNNIMEKSLKRIKQRAAYSAMETGDHFKNGASLKSHTSREFNNFYYHD